MNKRVRALAIWPVQKRLRAFDNYRRGFAYSYIRRCRACGHTAYYRDGHYGSGWGCRTGQVERARRQRRAA